MEGIKIDNVLMNLKEIKKMEIFYSEGDFRFCLGCEIKCMYSDIDIIAEKPIKRINNGKKVTEHIDMFLHSKESKIGIELKYIKDEFSGKVRGNYYELSPSSAYDVRCYDILKDIQRLESYLEGENVDERIDIGYSIVLTNAKALWEAKKNGKESNYDEFRVFDGRKLYGEMKWKPKTGEGTRKGRTDPIKLRDKHVYPIQWKHYSKPEVEGETENATKNLFRYMVVEVK